MYKFTGKMINHCKPILGPQPTLGMAKHQRQFSPTYQPANGLSTARSMHWLENDHKQKVAYIIQHPSWWNQVLLHGDDLLPNSSGRKSMSWLLCLSWSLCTSEYIQWKHWPRWLLLYYCIARGLQGCTVNHWNLGILLQTWSLSLVNLSLYAYSLTGTMFHILWSYIISIKRYLYFDTWFLQNIQVFAYFEWNFSLCQFNI